MKIAGILMVLLSLAITGLWVSHGADLATREKVAVITKVIDDFGDEEEEITWKEPTNYPLTGFHLGLDKTGPLSGGFFFVGAILIFLGFRKKKEA